MMGFGIVGLLLMVLLWDGLIALAVWLVRSLFPQATQPPAASTGQGVSARKILDHRYAQNEIDQEEYDMKKEAILDEIR
jgi:uncharacterized membrane protein